MREFQQKNRFHAVLYSKVTIVLLAFLVLLSLRSVVELNNKRLALKRSEEGVMKEKGDAEESLRSAKEKLDFIRTPRGEEEYIRSTYPVVSAGEGVVVVYTATSSPVVPVKKEEEVSTWDKIVKFLKNLL